MNSLENEMATLYVLRKIGFNIMNDEDLSKSEINSTDSYFESYEKYMNKFQHDFERGQGRDEFPTIGKYMRKINVNILRAKKEEVSISIAILRMIYDEYDEKCNNDQRMMNQEILIKQYHLF